MTKKYDGETYQKIEGLKAKISELEADQQRADEAIEDLVEKLQTAREGLGRVKPLLCNSGDGTLGRKCPEIYLNEQCWCIHCLVSDTLTALEDQNLDPVSPETKFSDEAEK